MRYRLMLATIGCVLLITVIAMVSRFDADPPDFSKVPVKGMVTMIDLGAKKCLPCISSIPTQIFFDREGKEVYRHAGFMGEEAIVAQLKNMGVE